MKEDTHKLRIVFVCLEAGDFITPVGVWVLEQHYAPGLSEGPQ